MFCNTPGKGAKDAKGMEAKKRVLEMIMQWADEEMLEELKARKGKPKAVEVSVLAAGKPAEDEESAEAEMESPAAEDPDEDDAEGGDIEERLERLFKKKK